MAAKIQGRKPKVYAFSSRTLLNPLNVKKVPATYVVKL